MALDLPKTSSIISKLKSAVSGKDVVAEKGWKTLIKASTQLGSLRNIVQENLSDQNSSLSQLVQSDEKVADLVDRLSGKSLVSVQEKIMGKEKISEGEMGMLVNEFEDITEQMEEVGLKLDVSFGSVIKDMGSLIADSRIDRESRRKILEDVTSLAAEKSTEAKEQGQDTSNIDKNIEEMRSVMSSSLNFNDDQVDYLRGIFNELSKDQSINAKSSLALNEISNKMDSAALTSGEMKDLMKQEAEGGRSLRELLMDMPGRFSTGGLGSGILTTMLDAIAPGLTPALVMLGPALKSLVGGVGAFLGMPALGAFKGASVMGKLGVIGKVLGKVAIVITALIAIKDFFKGFKDAAEISGEEFPSLGTKIQAGIASALSGLTFGLVKTKQAYNAMDGFKLAVDDFSDWLLGSRISDAWDGFKLAVTDFSNWAVETFSADKISEAWGGFKLAVTDFSDWVVSGDALSDVIEKVKDMVTGFGKWISSYIEDSWIFSKFFPKQVEEKGTKSGTKSGIPSIKSKNIPIDKAVSNAIAGSITQARGVQAVSKKQQTPVTIPQSPPRQPKVTSTRGKYNIDDLQLAFINSPALG